MCVGRPPSPDVASASYCPCAPLPAERSNLPLLCEQLHVRLQSDCRFWVSAHPESTFLRGSRQLPTGGSPFVHEPRDPSTPGGSLLSKVTGLASFHIESFCPQRWTESQFWWVLHTFFLWLVCLMLDEHHTVINTQVNIYMQI